MISLRRVAVWALRGITIASLSMNQFAHAQVLPTDVFARHAALASAPRDDINRLALDTTLGRAGAETRVERWLVSHVGASEDERIVGLLALCSARFRRQRYEAALDVCSEAESLRSGVATAILPLLRAARDVPPLAWSRTGVLLDLEDRHVVVSNNHVSVTALVDTGAEIAVVMESVARQLGGRALSGEVSMETTTTPVAGGLVVFDRLTIGSAELRNLIALVLPDDALELGEGDTLHLVLSLPVVTALGRAAFLEHGARLALGSAAPRVGRRSVPLYWDGSGVGFAAAFANGGRGVHFDTGSRRTWLFPAALAVLSAAELATREPFDRTIGGLGGERTESASRLRGVVLAIAGQPWRFDTIEVAQDDENGEAARVGFDLFGRFETVSLDFSAMRMMVRQ